MQDWLVRVEAVNLDSFVYDTQDVSTVRGGGLLLLDMAAQLDCGLTKVFTSGSIGLFRARSDSAAGLKAKVLEWLASKPALNEAGILVDVAEFDESNGDFPAAHDRARAGIRWSQMQAPAIVYPVDLDQTQVCYYDRIRPAPKTDPKKEDNRDSNPVSTVTHVRRRYGIERKQRFYASEARVDPAWKYTFDLDQLTDDREAGYLHHKMALIYLDGNKFSKIVGACLSPWELGECSRTLRANQGSILRRILDEMTSGRLARHRTHYRHEKDGEILRVETLLWGGDEIIWAVPAWLGWWWMKQFFTHYGRLGSWQLDGQTVTTTDNYKGSPLTHGAAVVFCHHDAPLQRIISLARNLADWPKSKGMVNTFTYQTLESFDYLGEDVEGIRRRRLPQELVPVDDGEAPDFYCLPGSNMEQIERSMRKLHSCVPKGELHALVQILCRDRDFAEGLKAAAVLVKKSEKRDVKARQYLDELVAALGMANYTADQRQAAAWIHLLELWDYVVDPEPADGQPDAAGTTRSASSLSEGARNQ